MTIPPVTFSACDHLHSNPVSITITDQPINRHCTEPHPLSAASINTSGSLPMADQCLNRVKEELQNISQLVSEGFASGWVGGASGRIKAKKLKYSIHKSNQGNDKQIVRYSFITYFC